MPDSSEDVVPEGLGKMGEMVTESDLTVLLSRLIGLTEGSEEDIEACFRLLMWWRLG